MAKIAERFNVGDRDNLTLERLLVLMEEMYMDLAEAVNKKPDVYIRNTNGQTTDTLLANGDININSNTLNIEMLVEHTTPAAVIWQAI